MLGFLGGIGFLERPGYLLFILFLFPCFLARDKRIETLAIDHGCIREGHESLGVGLRDKISKSLQFSVGKGDANHFALFSGIGANPIENGGGALHFRHNIIDDFLVFVRNDFRDDYVDLKP